MSHAVIVGGTRGIGLAVARTLVAKDWQVTLIGRRPPAQQGLDLTRISYLPGDLARPDEILVRFRGREARGPLTALVFAQRFRGDADSWAGQLQITLSATKELIEGLTPAFADQGGAIMAISSSASDFVADNQPVDYHVVKAGLNQLVRYFAVRLGRKNIRVNAVSPGTVLKEESRRYYLDNKALHELYRRITPLGRMGTAEEVADAVAFLCSDSASFITGQNLCIDGGLSLRLHDSLARQFLDPDEGRMKGD